VGRKTVAMLRGSGRLPVLGPLARKSSRALARGEPRQALACLPEAAVGDTQRTMANEESTAPNPVARLRQSIDAIDRRDFRCLAAPPTPRVLAPSQ
jgi:hypothetical protein